MEVTQLSQILGGERVLRMRVRTRLDLVTLGERGIPKRALMHLVAYSHWPVARMAKLLPITERTIQRYGNDDRFSPAVSEQILEIAEVLGRGREVFGAPAGFADWMEQPSPALANRSPVDLLTSRFGIELVLDELGRIEHGIAS